jgi:hypothetical protein
MELFWARLSIFLLGLALKIAFSLSAFSFQPGLVFWPPTLPVPLLLKADG